MRKLYILLLSVAILTTSCTNSDRNTVVSGEIMKIDTDKSKNLYDNGSKIAVIEFNDSAEKFFGSIDKLEIVNDTLYALDMFMQRGLYAYDLKSLPLNPLFVYDRRGNGPGEFNSISDFQIVNDAILLLDGVNGKIIRLDKYGNYIDSEDAEKYSEALMPEGDGIWYDMGNAKRGENKEKLLFVENGKRITALEITENIANISMLSIPTFSRSGNGSIYYMAQAEPRIYRLESGKAEPAYELDFGAKWEDFNPSFMDNPLENIKKLVEEGKVYQTGIYTEGNLLGVKFHSGDNIYAYVINTDTNKGSLYNVPEKIFDDFYGFYKGNLVFGNENKLMFITPQD